MPETDAKHRILMAGLRVFQKTPPFPSALDGTLTGSATRNSDGETVLVSNLHVMVRPRDLTNPRGNEEFYQVSAIAPGNKIGTIDAWVDIKETRAWPFSDPENVADTATATLEAGVLAGFELHNDSHDLGTVVLGTRDPKVGDRLIMVGAYTGPSPVTVIRTDLEQEVNFVGTKAKFTGLVELRVDQVPAQVGDSGAACVVEDEDSPGRFHMVCVAFGGNVSGSRMLAFPASVAESKLGITFGFQAKLTTRSEHNMGIPILTSEGFVGQRMIIDDYFQAGETLHAGDVVIVRQRSTAPYLTRVYKATSDHQRRVIGIVHTPAGKEVGDKVAGAGNLVCIVVQGLAQALTARAIGVGDPVTPSGNSGPAPDNTNFVARVGLSTSNQDALIGRALTETRGANQEVDILVDIAGGYDSTVEARETARTKMDSTRPRALQWPPATPAAS